jgi:hypothetical protein
MPEPNGMYPATLKFASEVIVIGTFSTPVHAVNLTQTSDMAAGARRHQNQDDIDNQNVDTLFVVGYASAENWLFLFGGIFWRY